MIDIIIGIFACVMAIAIIFMLLVMLGILWLHFRETLREYKHEQIKREGRGAELV